MFLVHCCAKICRLDCHRQLTAEASRAFRGRTSATGHREWLVRAIRLSRGTEGVNMMDNYTSCTSPAGITPGRVVSGDVDPCIKNHWGKPGFSRACDKGVDARNYREFSGGRRKLVHKTFSTFFRSWCNIAAGS